MKESLGDVSPESDPKKEIDDFIKGFEGVTLTNSEGKEIHLKVSHLESPNPFKDEEYAEAITIEFEGYQGDEAGKEGNYMNLVITPGNKEVYLSYIRLSDPDLRGKGIYSQLMNLVGKNFPEAYEFAWVIEHEETRDRARDLFAQYKDGKLSEDSLRASLRENWMLQSAHGAGFNNFIVTFDAKGQIDVVAKKNTEAEDLALTTKVDPLDEDDASK